MVAVALRQMGLRLKFMFWENVWLKKNYPYAREVLKSALRRVLACCSDDRERSFMKMLATAIWDSPADPSHLHLAELFLRESERQAMCREDRVE